MTKFGFAILALSAVVSGVALAQQKRVGSECRREIIKLCGVPRNRDSIKTCLISKVRELSADCRTEVLARVKANAGGARQSSVRGGTPHSYGSDAKQTLEYWPITAKTNRPGLVVFVHGGGWLIGDKDSGTGTKPLFYNGLGYAFASINYRLVPQVKPDGQAADVAAAIAFLRKDAVRLGFDPDHIVLMGHSAGAHLAALVSSDPAYLRSAGVPLSAIKGAILLDGAGYDVAQQMASKENRANTLYQAAFGNDPAAQKALSPMTHIAAPNAANWLLLHVASRADSGAQSAALGAGLSANGARASVTAVPGSSHMSVNNDAGTAGTFVANQITAFLRGL